MSFHLQRFSLTRSGDIVTWSEDQFTVNSSLLAVFTISSEESIVRGLKVLRIESVRNFGLVLPRFRRSILS